MDVSIYKKIPGLYKGMGEAPYQTHLQHDVWTAPPRTVY